MKVDIIFQFKHGIKRGCLVKKVGRFYEECGLGDYCDGIIVSVINRDLFALSTHGSFVSVDDVGIKLIEETND